MIFPLVTFDNLLWPSGATATLISATDLPKPYLELLAHMMHMTETVEAFYRESVNVRVLSSGRDGDFYHRRILLTLRSTGRVVQYGGVRINLDFCSESVRALVLEEKTPLGRVLADQNVLRRVEPTAFLRIGPSPAFASQLGADPGLAMYGRTGVIFCHDQPAIAVVEILAPIA